MTLCSIPILGDLHDHELGHDLFDDNFANKKTCIEYHDYRSGVIHDWLNFMNLCASLPFSIEINSLSACS